MKLYNKTKCPKELLYPLLVAAGESVGARTSRTVVKVTQGRGSRIKGVAYNYRTVYTHHLHRKRQKYKGTLRTLGRSIFCEGYFEITLPAKGTHRGQDEIDKARTFYEVAQHEWAHIRDYQERTRFEERRTPTGRRPRWKDRPIEIAACNRVEDARKMSNQDDLILNLAIYLNE